MSKARKDDNHDDNDNDIDGGGFGIIEECKKAHLSKARNNDDDDNLDGGEFVVQQG